MTNEELESFLKMGADEEEILELLRQAERQEGLADDTRGKDYLINAGRVNVANPWGAVSDMFVRGNAEKKAEKARGEAANARAQMDQTSVRDFHRAASGQGLGGVELNARPEIPERPLQIPNAPQVPQPPPAMGGGPVGPPAPNAAPAAPPAAPAPTPPPAQPPGPPQPPKTASGAFQSHPGWDDVPGLPQTEEEEALALIAALRGGQ